MTSSQISEKDLQEFQKNEHFINKKLQNVN